VPSIGFGEIVVILLLALIIFAPKRLPEMGKTVGRSLREFRRATTEMARNNISERVLGMPRERTLDKDVPFRDVPKGPPSANA
jgi:sec-independent protein translocase protein TatA